MRPKPIPIHHIIRGIAALWVALAHLVFNPIYKVGSVHYSDLGWFAIPLRFDFLAVDFFFVISGCLLTLSYRDLFEKKSTGGKIIDQFYLLRLARIYPLHLATLAFIFITAYFGMEWPHTAGHWQWLWEHKNASISANLALMHAWGIIPAAAWNEPAWTISIFAFLYVLFPNLIYLTRKIPERLSLPIIFGLLTLYAMQREIFPTGGQSDGLGAIIRGSCFFLTGMFVARLEQQEWKKTWPWKMILAGSLLVAVALMVAMTHKLFMNLMPFHLLYPGLMLAALRVTMDPTHATAKPLLWLGSRAYSLYMVHYPVMLTLGLVAGETLATLTGIAKLLIYIVTMICLCLVAELGYRGVERPCYRAAKARISLA